MAYYCHLRKILRCRQDLRSLCTRCRICGIFFLTDPRNVGRIDLRCPFGCQCVDQTRQSTERSAAYYRTPEGKAKKKAQNAKRRAAAAPPPPPTEVPALAHHLALIISEIERRAVTVSEILMLLRQQGFDIGPRHRHIRRPRGQGPP